MEKIVAWIVVGVTVAAAILLGYHQLRVRRWLKQHEASLSSEDVSYYRWSIGRRLTGCVLLMLLAAMIAGIYWFNIASGLEELMALGNQVKDSGQKLTAEQEAFVYSSMRYVASLLIVLMLIFFLAGWDMMAIRRYGNRHRQRIRDDRRAMLERQLPILYAERRAMKEQDE